jgi:hypothetical protein
LVSRPPTFSILLHRSDRPSMAWLRHPPLRLPKCSSFRGPQSRFPGIVAHQLRLRWWGLRLMARRRRWFLPRPEPLYRRAQRASPYGAVGIAVAAGVRAAHRIRKITPAPMGRAVRRSTQRPRDLRSPTRARTGVRRSTLALMPRRLRRPTPVPTRHKSTRVQLAVCAGWLARNPMACNRANAWSPATPVTER